MRGALLAIQLLSRLNSFTRANSHSAAFRGGTADSDTKLYIRASVAEREMTASKSLSSRFG